MNRELINTLVLATAFLLLFGVAEWLYHRRQVRAEHTRKLVHAGTGILTLMFPVVLNSHWLVLLLCSSFFIILIFSILRGYLPSIHAVGRETVGSLAYPVAVYGAYLAFEHCGKKHFNFYLPVLILAISDPIAALVGKYRPFLPYTIGTTRKTLSGSAGFFFSAFALCYVLGLAMTGHYPDAPELLRMGLVSFSATLAEAVSGKGYDNITIPAAVILTLIFTGLC